MRKRKSMHRDDAIRNRIQYWQRVQQMYDIHEMKEKSIHFRKKLLEDQTRANYQHEYDRIRGILAHTVVPIQTKRTIENRMSQLKKLGAQIT